MKTVIFKFNGILYQDTAQRKKSWSRFALQEFDRDIAETDYKNHITGQNYKYIMEYLAGKPLSNKQLVELLSKKVKIYQQICRDEQKQISLVCGAKFLLKELKDRKINCLLITLIERSKFNFYMEKFNLDDWFSREDIIYLGYNALEKADLDFYKRLVTTIKVSPEDCILFENTPAGIIAARRAGFGNIVALSSSLDKKVFLNIEGIADVIDNFHEFNRLLLRD